MRLLALAAPLLLATAAVVWSGLSLPPPLWVAKYGPFPGCEPTGRGWTFQGVRFVEIGPGISRVGSDWLLECRHGDGTAGDLLGRVSDPIDLAWGEAPVRPAEMPVRWVQFPRGFAIAEAEITNTQFERWDPEHERSSLSGGDDHPAGNVSWEEARDYCAWLAARCGRPVRLPSEAEWECACRAGSSTSYSFGEDPAGLDDHAWHDGNSGRRAHAVRAKRANAWGLHDLHGNVWEWCQDAFHESQVDAPDDGRPRTEVGVDWSGVPCRAMRGGCWCSEPAVCRASFRLPYIETGRGGYLGFRPAFTPPDR